MSATIARNNSFIWYLVFILVTFATLLLLNIDTFCRLDNCLCVKTHADVCKLNFDHVSYIFFNYNPYLSISNVGSISVDVWQAAAAAKGFNICMAQQFVAYDAINLDGPVQHFSSIPIPVGLPKDVNRKREAKNNSNSSKWKKR